jgi:hypothetical protein
MPHINKICLSEKCLDFIVKNIEKFCMKSGRETNYRLLEEIVSDIGFRGNRFNQKDRKNEF